ncbi:hypothetical protein C0Q70_21002 [Pomacea canaliculata]|uniref:Sodium/hydrogen exchanger n=1 Tax=Pomacea canaliculata TaxID=400727 RepID=A0A2T7NBB1_POMCA|nr:hypothetical protein C0Q70_21002 [Pomacea canaliculata]
MLIVLGTAFGAIIHFSQVSKELPELFSPHQFFVFLLPPIILESAFSLYDRTFSENLGTVLLFAVLGTILACFLLGLSLYGLMLCGAMGDIEHISLVQILLFSSLIVAVDPVAVLAVFNEIGVNHVLYFIVFGESLLNDGVTVVLYKVMQVYNEMGTIPIAQIVLGIVKFVVVCAGGLLIGVLAGIVTAVLTKYTYHVRVVQPLVIYTMAYLGFLMAELFEVSGIISIIGCGLIQCHYAFHNISPKSRITVKYFTKVLASASEIIIFLFLGLVMVHDDHEWHTGFVLWTLLLCLVYRFIIVFAMASLINRFDRMRVRRITTDEMFMIAYGGLRGAVAFSLAALLDDKSLPMKQMFVTTTLSTIIFTVFVQGITIKPLVTLLAIKLEPEKNQSMYCELNGHVTDHLMAGIEVVVGMHGRNHLREELDRLDVDYMQKWLVLTPVNSDTQLHDFYEKIVMKEHYKHLKLCKAASMIGESNLPRVDTEYYLKGLTEKEVEEEGEEVTLRKHGEIVPPVSIRQFSRGPPPSDINNAHKLRALLQSQRFSRMLLHNNYDRNLTTDNIYNLSHELKKKTLKNQQLGRILSQIRSRPASWTEDQAQMCTDRGSEKSDLEKNRPSKKRQSADHRPGPAHSDNTPTTPPLDCVFEEDEVNKEDKSDNAATPLMQASLGRGRGSRNRLQRQDDIKMDDLASLQSGKSVD